MSTSMFRHSQTKRARKTSLHSHGELVSPTKPGLSVHAWNHSGMFFRVMECQNMGETNYYRRCDFFKSDLKILNHFYKKTAANGRCWNLGVWFFIHDLSKICSISKNHMSFKNGKNPSLR